MVIKESYYKLQYLETVKHTENVLKDIFKRHVMASRSSHLVAVFCEKSCYRNIKRINSPGASNRSI